MDTNEMVENPVETNKYEFPIDNYSTAPNQILIITGSPNDHSAFSSNSRPSTSHSRLSISVTPDKGRPSNNMANTLSKETMKVHLLRKYPIYPKERTKTHYERLEDSHSDYSHGDKYTEHYEGK